MAISNVVVVVCINGTFIIKGESGSVIQRVAQVHIQVQVIDDLQLREQPDPRARNILGAPPNDKMPKGSQVAVIDTCRTWMGSGRGAQDADNIWCPVLYDRILHGRLKSFDDIVDHAATPGTQPWKIMSIARRDWATVGYSS